MYIPRLIHPQLKKSVKTSPITVLTGPRQSGKTSTVKHLFPDYHYLSFEDPDNLLFASQDPRRFLTQYSQKVILDEVQKVPELLSYLQTHVDTINQPGMYILTGSQNLLLLNQLSQTLAGRTLNYTLLPLSYAELRASSNAPQELESVIYTGSYPRIFDQSPQISDWYRSYIQAYVERDVRDLLKISDLTSFQTFLRLLAGRAGQILNLSDLARDAGISVNTVKAWLSILESSYIIFLLKPYYRNWGKRLVKAAKLYFIDTGLASSLLLIRQPEDIVAHFARGALFENWVVMEIYKQLINLPASPNLYYWRDKTGHEVDLLMETGSNAVSLIEIKSGATINPEFFDQLQYLSQLAPIHNKFLVYGGQKFEKRSAATVCPWNLLSRIIPH